jgi:hypothetical protein
VQPLGARASGRHKLVAVQHDVAWLDDPHGQSMAGARMDLTFANGEQRPIQIRALPTKYYLKGGLYGGLDGWFHGDDKGALHTAHESWDLADAATRRKVRTLADQVIEVREGDEIGWGIIEYGVGRGYEKYLAVQVFPPI